MYENIIYPIEARENGVEGLVVIEFVVEKDGSLSGIKPIRDIGGGFGDEAVRVINSMNEKEMKWKLGTQRGENVRVRYLLPIRFKLAGKTKLKKKKRFFHRNDKE